MSGKKKPAGKQIALCLLLTAAVDGLGVLLVTLLAAAALAVFVFVPQLAVTGLGWVAALWFAANAVFLMYDVALSRLIALLRRSLPPD